jgi:hypothetical protein
VPATHTAPQVEVCVVHTGVERAPIAIGATAWPKHTQTMHGSRRVPAEWHRL